MTKLSLNQNAKFVQELRDTIETNFDLVISHKIE